MLNNESYNEKSIFENILEILLCYKTLTTVFIESWSLWNCSFLWSQKYQDHYNDIIMSAMASQIISLMIVYSNVYSGGNQRKHKSSASLAFVRGIHWWLVNSPHKGAVTWKMFPFDNVIMISAYFHGMMPFGHPANFMPSRATEPTGLYCTCTIALTFAYVSSAGVTSAAWCIIIYFIFKV